MKTAIHPVLVATALLTGWAPSPTVAADAPDFLADSARVDALVAAEFAEGKTVANPMTSDPVFVRRAYLDLIGRIPTAAEAKSFIASKDAAKRGKLIDSLMDSDGYVSHQFNYWADVLRFKTRISGAGQSLSAGHAYARFLKDAIRDNKPYDELVYELVSAQGRSWENGAIGYYLRDYGMNLDNMAVTTQIFLGTSVACAQCHNHPFDKWSQMDFYQAAAFQYNVSTTNNSGNQSEAMAMLAKDKKKGKDSKYRREVSRAFSEILKPLRFNNVNFAKRGLRLPGDYQYGDAKPKDVVTPGVIFGHEAKIKEGESPVTAYARWIASRDTPRFTKVITNRMWKKVMGLGLFEPVDEIMDHTEPSNPKLMAFLEDRMEAYDFDLKKFTGMLYNTKTYQRTSSTEDVLPGEKYYFAGPLLRRMSAEQIWDSLVTLIADDVDAPNPYSTMAGEKLITRTRWIAESVYDQSPREILQGARKIAATQKKLSGEIKGLTAKREKARAAGDKALVKKLTTAGTSKQRELVKAVESTVYQKGYKDKVELVAMKDFKPEETGNEFLSELADCIADDSLMEKAGGADSPMTEVVKAVLSEREQELKKWSDARRAREWKEWGVESAAEKKSWYSYNNLRTSQVIRASDMPQPAPVEHFLREFGQADREVVQNFSDEASITQALTMLNNTSLHAWLRSPYSTLRRGVGNAKTPAAKLDALYLSLLSRKPNAVEKKLLLPMIENNPSGGPLDVAWTLVNTRQFLFIQ